MAKKTGQVVNETLVDVLDQIRDLSFDAHNEEDGTYGKIVSFAEVVIIVNNSMKEY